MGEGSTELHEAAGALQQSTVEAHRAYRSLIEELDAVDWYNQRIDASTDSELKAVLTHNRDEEKEHAAMVLEWLRRRDPVLDRYLREYLFSDKSLEAHVREEEGTDASEPEAPPPGLGIGRLDHAASAKR